MNFKERFAIALTSISLLFYLPLSACSTFMLSNGKSFLIGHNLDENMDIPGMIYINKRGVEKESISFFELYNGVNDSLPKIKWISKYGSVTYNAFGRELIDGGLNEAGLYIGEMSLNQNHQYPVYENKPKIAVALWLQYILDNFANIDDVLNFIPEANLENGLGFSWHFFVTDKQGNQAIIEFINGETVIYRNDEIPVKLLCNNQYSIDMDTLKLFKGYGGNRAIDLNDKSQDYRMVQGAQMLEYNKQNPAVPDVNYAFDILKQLDYGNNKWSIVFDVKNRRMYYRTNKDPDVKHFDFSSFDFSCKEPVMMLDINKDLPGGNVNEFFVPYNKEANKSHIMELFMGFEGLKEKPALPEMVERFANYPETFKCLY